MDAHLLRQRLEHALAFAHAALDDSLELHVAQARRYASQVLAQVTPARDGVTLADGHDLLALLEQLRRVVGLLEKKLARAGAPATPSTT